MKQKGKKRQREKKDCRTYLQTKEKGNKNWGKHKRNEMIKIKRI